MGEKKQSHGTLLVCGPACDKLTDPIKGSKKQARALWHRVIVDIVHGRDEKGKRYSQGAAWVKHNDCTAKSARRNVWRMLQNPDAKACMAHHRAEDDKASKLFADRLLYLEELQAESNLYDLVDVKNFDDAAWQNLERLCREGVKTVDQETGRQGFRPPTDAEKRRAANAACTFRLKTGEELTWEQQMQIEGASYDSRGSIKVDLGRAGARVRVAKLRGLTVDRVQIEKAVQPELERMWASVAGALQEICPEFEERVLKRAAGLYDPNALPAPEELPEATAEEVN